MLRLGLIGTESGLKSGHAGMVCSFINKEYDWDAKFVAVFGEDEEDTKEIAEFGGIDLIVSDVNEMIDKVDAVFVMFRDGNKHLKYAKPFLEKGMPVFIDKPYVCTMEDAEELIDLAKKNNCIIGGGSSLRYAECIKIAKEEVSKATKIFSGMVAYPQHLENPYCGIHFYSNHVIEPMIEIFGTDVKSLNITPSGDRFIGAVNYENFPVILNGACHQGDIYVGAYLQGYDMVHEKFDMEPIDVIWCKHFLDCVKAGEPCLDFDHILASVKLSCAMEKSIETKGIVEL